jgi:NhaP-type Na+/H+ or K+/H+ antiporter
MNIVLIFLVLLGAIGVSALAHRKGLQPALIIVVVGFGASFIPGVPRLEVSSELILGVVLPPLLFSAALNFSVSRFVRNLRPILGLGVSLVIVTAIAVGFVASAIVPGLALSTAILLGAVVAPPDAVTAAAIGNKLGLPRRVMDLLTGESLVNDAAALTLFTIAVSAVAGTHTLFANPVLLFAYAAIAGALLGVVLGVFANILRRHLKDAGLETVLGIMLPFAAYFIAEQVEASGVLAVVFAAFAVGSAKDRVGYQTRLQEKQVWSSFDVLLEAFVFAYMGLQLRFVVGDVIAADLPVARVFALGCGILLLVMLVRPLFVFALYAQGVLRKRGAEKRWAVSERFRRRLERQTTIRLNRGRPPRQDFEPMTLPEAAVVSWSGMRGVVTIAAAAAIPLSTSSGEDFPGRALIQAVAFTVAVGTLLIQGATLPALIRRLRLPNDDDQRRDNDARVLEVVRVAFSRVMADFMDTPPAGITPELLGHFRMIAQQRIEAAAQPQAPDPRDAAVFDTLLQTLLQAQRDAVLVERDRGNLDPDAVDSVIERLDHQEAAVASRLENRL